MRLELERGLDYIRQRLEWDGEFDPMHNSSHALKLMALLTIELRYDWEKSTKIVITRPNPDDRRDVGGWCTADLQPDPEAAIRECITSSAACVGRDMLAKLNPPTPTKARRPSEIPVGTLLPIDGIIHRWDGTEWTYVDPKDEM